MEVQVGEILEVGLPVVYDSLLILKSSPGKGKALVILDLNNFSIISKTVSIGRGPGELANPAGMVIDESHKMIWLTDWGKDIIARFPIDSILDNPDYKSTEHVDLNPGWIPTMNMGYYPSGHIGFTSVMLQKSLVYFMNLKGELVDSLAIPNKVYSDIWKDGGISDVPLICKYIPERNKVVVVSRHENTFSVIDLDGNPIFQKFEFPFARASDQSSGSFVTFYTVEADEEFIYLFYVGKNFLEYDTELERGVPNYPTKLYVIDWEGEERYEINLDHPLFYLTLDKTGKRIIGLTNDVDNYLVSYDLSGFYNQ